MLAEIEQLKSQLSQAQLEHDREIQIIRSDREQEVTAIIAEKTAVVTDTHAEVMRLRDENASLRAELARSNDELVQTRAELRTKVGDL